METDTKKLNLLVVEDDFFTAKVVVRMLGKLWRKITVACSCDSGLEELSKGDHDVVLTDWDCPIQGDGIRIVEATDLPVVVHTGDIRANVPAGIRVLHKPCRIAKMQQVLVEAYMLRKKRQGKE